MKKLFCVWLTALGLGLSSVTARAASNASGGGGEWEVTPESERAVERGLDWLTRNQGPEGNWGSNNLGLVGLGALAYLSAGHLPDQGRHGQACRKALDFILANAKPSGLLNISNQHHDMYNHGLATFVLTQAYGETNDKRMTPVLHNAVKFICDMQCDDGGWDYEAVKKPTGHDLSLAVMQAKALRGAMDMGLDIQPQYIDKAIKFVRRCYGAAEQPDGLGSQYGPDPLAQRPGRFAYSGGGKGEGTTAMAAAGVVCLQEFGKYEDFRIHRSIDAVIKDLNAAQAERQDDKKKLVRKGEVPFDAYTLYYVAQGFYQVGGDRWRKNYPILREALVNSQDDSTRGYEGSWQCGKYMGGKEGAMWGTAVAVFTLSIPNRYLPILQEAHQVRPGSGGNP